MIVKVKRQDNASSRPYYDTFTYEKQGKFTVIEILEDINNREELLDANGDKVRRIRWECSCQQKMCGACAMVVNHEAVLACSKYIDTDKTKKLTIEPLTKFPTVVDLVVDRSVIQEHLKETQIYVGEMGQANEKEFAYRYLAAKCLKCGLCLEVCTNYKGDSNDKFHGAIMANEAYLMSTSSQDRTKEIKQEYKKHFEATCSKSLACRDICPAKISTLASIGYMNR